VGRAVVQEVDPAVIVTEELPLVAWYVPAEVYVWLTVPMVLPPEMDSPVPSPKEMPVPTPEKATVRGREPEVGVAEKPEVLVEVTVICAVAMVFPEESRRVAG
jgi:hypothetical protein